MNRSLALLVLVGSGVAIVACTQFGVVSEEPPADAGVAEAASGVAPTDASLPDTFAGDAGSLDSALRNCDEPGLLGRWPLQEGVGTRVLDCTSGARHGDLIGGAWVPRDGGIALSFVGGDNGMRVDLGNPAAFRLEGSMTLSAWVNVKSVASYGRIFAKSALEGDRGWDLFLDVDGALELRIATGPSSYVEVRRPGFPLRMWKHVTGVYDAGAALRIYVDGVEVASNTAGIPAAARNSTRDVYIGARSDCCTLDGALYDVRLYNRALSVAQIGAIFRAK